MSKYSDFFLVGLLTLATCPGRASTVVANYSLPSHNSDLENSYPVTNRCVYGVTDETIPQMLETSPLRLTLLERFRSKNIRLIGGVKFKHGAMLGGKPLTTIEARTSAMVQKGGIFSTYQTTCVASLILRQGDLLNQSVTARFELKGRSKRIVDATCAEALAQALEELHPCRN